MNRSLVGVVLAVGVSFALGCGDSTSPPSPTSIVFSPPSVTLDAIGASQLVTATVLDQRGHAMPNAVITWSSNTPVVGIQPLVTASVPSANVIASVNGSGTVLAATGTIQANLPVTVAQVPATIQKVAGDQQLGTVNRPVPRVISVRVTDRLGIPVANQHVTFSIASGGGSITGGDQTTDVTGVATLGSWTLGALVGSNSLTVSAGSNSIASIVITATALLTSVPTAIVSNAGGNQAVMAGQPVTTLPSVLVTDSLGAPVQGVGVLFALSAGSGTITGTAATTNAAGIATLGGWTLDSRATYNAVSASVPGLGQNPLVFSAAGCEGGGGAGFAITVCYLTPMTPTQQQAFVDAAARWGKIITSDLPDVPAGVIPENACGTGSPSVGIPIDDILIFAAVTTIDGPGGILGSAGPCVIRGPAGLPIIGTMHFDVADVTNLEAQGSLSSVILHEMGHVIGIGSYWAFKGLLQNPSAANSQLDTYFSGANGIAGFNDIGGATYTGGQKVPVENSGGSGTINVHWRESVLQNELMTGFLNPGSNPLSMLTVSSLVDLGYTVDTTQADAFSLALSLRGPVFDLGSPGTVSLGNDGYAGPMWTVDSRGRITRIR